MGSTENSRWSVRESGVRWLALVSLVILSGCQQKMARQPSYRPLQASSFFTDGRSARPPVAGTVSQGLEPYDDPLLFAGKDEQQKNLLEAVSLIGAPSLLSMAALRGGAVLDYTSVFPFPVTKEVLDRGRERFLIFCVVCHDPTGNGNGKIVIAAIPSRPRISSIAPAACSAAVTTFCCAMAGRVLLRGCQQRL